MFAVFSFWSACLLLHSVLVVWCLCDDVSCSSCFLIKFVYKTSSLIAALIVCFCSVCFHCFDWLKSINLFLIVCSFCLRNVIELDLISNVSTNVPKTCETIMWLSFLGWILTTRTERDPANFQGKPSTCFQPSHWTTHHVLSLYVLLFYCFLLFCVFQQCNRVRTISNHLMFCVLDLWFLSVRFLFKGAVSIVSLRPMVKSLHF